MPKTCETCKFWCREETAAGPAEFLNETAKYAMRVDAEGYVDGGECRRYPPPAVVVADSWPENAEGVWPITLPLEWCGEWKKGVR